LCYLQVEEFLMQHDLRSVLQQYVSQVVLTQGEKPFEELANLLLAHQATVAGKAEE
jgi:hypothetical protein